MRELLEFIEGYDGAISLCLLGGLLVVFLLELYPPEVPAAGLASLFVALGFVSGQELRLVFSNPAPLTIGAMFILSGALVRTGVLEAMSEKVLARARENAAVALTFLFCATLVASGFVNNTAIVMVLIPVVLRLAPDIGIAPTRLLMPLSYVAILGGTCTLIGTSTNLLVDGVAREQGLEAFGIFEITPIGILLTVSGGITLAVLGRWLLPDRETFDPEHLTGSVTFLSEAVLTGNGYVGKVPGDVSSFGRSTVTLIAVHRKGTTITSALEDLELEDGDRLSFTAPTSELLTMHDDPGLDVGLFAKELPARDLVIVEVVVSPRKPNIGRTLADMSLGRRYGVRVLGARRQGQDSASDLGAMRLHPADSLLLEGPGHAFQALEDEAQLVSVSRPTGRAFRRERAPMVLLALACVVGLAAFGLAEVATLSMLAVAAIMLLRCIDASEGWAAIDGSVLVLIFAMLVVGQGLQNTGAIDLIIGWITPLMTDLSPFFALLVVYLIASALTETVTNNAVAVVYTPIAIGLADSAGLDPRASVLAVMFGASASFATPIGYQTNTLIYGAGNYRFSDFLRIGLPMNVVSAITACAGILWLYG